MLTRSLFEVANLVVDVMIALVNAVVGLHYMSMIVSVWNHQNLSL